MSLLVESVVYTPKYPVFVEITEKHERAHWGTWEVKLDQDVQDWQLGRITDVEKKFNTTVLRLFTQSDLVVGGLYYDALIPFIKNSEARDMLGSFASREGTHKRAYALLNDTLGFGEDFYSEFLQYDAMKDKVEFMAEVDTSSVEGVIRSLPKQGLTEGLCLFASFAMLLNNVRNGKLNGQGDVVQWSIRDESIHVEGLAALFHTLVKENPHVINNEFKKSVYDMNRECIALEDAFIDLAFEHGAPEGITADECKQYIRAVSDYRMQQFGFKPEFGVDNPFDWLDWVVSSDMKENFFEVNTAAYSKDNLTGEFKDGY